MYFFCQDHIKTKKLDIRKISIHNLKVRYVLIWKKKTFQIILK